MSNTLSKEEILTDKWDEKYGSPQYKVSHMKRNYEDLVLKAMDLYAQQEAIGFHRWVSRSGWKVSHFDAAGGDIYLHESSGSIPFYELNETHYKTTEELYNLYLKSKTPTKP